MKLHEYYRRTADRMDAWKGRAFEPEFAPCKELLEMARPYLKRGRRVLDIGCQGGHQLALIAKWYDESFGLDIATYDEIWAAYPGSTFVVHDIDEAPLPFPDRHFDCIICTNVLEHVFDVFGAVREISRVLKPSATCLISVPNVAFVGHWLELARGRVPRTGAQEFPFDEKQG